MTAKELQEYRHLRRLIECNKSKLAEISARLDPRSSDFSGMPRSGSTRNLTEENTGLYIDLKNILEEQQRDYLRRQVEIERFVGTIDDLYMRRIISYRFIDGLTWRRTALKMGGGNTSDGVRMACNRFIRRLD